jgi:hypothetical protein
MRMRGIFLNFLAQLVYHDAEILRLLGVIGSPDNLQQSPMGERLSLLNYERAQDVEFFWTQVDSVTADIDDSLLEINAQFWSLDFGEGLIGGGPSHCRPDACQQFTDGEGFYDIVIRPRVERENLVLLRVSDGDRDNRALKDNRILLQTSNPLMPGMFNPRESDLDDPE